MRVSQSLKSALMLSPNGLRLPPYLRNICCLQVIGAGTASSMQLPVQSQVLFSSTSSVWSQSGAGHYAAANAFLDGLASQRQHAGLPAMAVQFGPFAGTGMASEHVAALASLGLHSLSPKEARYITSIPITSGSITLLKDMYCTPFMHKLKGPFHRDQELV